MKRLKTRLLFACAAVFISRISFAVDAPQISVTDDTINWPPIDAITINIHAGDGRWLESIPGDKTSWTAPANGDYFLVGADHGDWREWGKSSTVTIDVGRQTDRIIVNGQTISWPNDGWYQVQNRNSYVTLCEGTRDCTVENGTYIVINHTTKERWEGIVVGAGGSTVEPVMTQPQLPIIGTDLAGNDVITLDYSVDGVSIFANPFVNSYTTLPDVDGDGIPEMFALVQEPGEECPSTIVYLPSRQTRSANLNSSDLTQYTRIRNTVEVYPNGGCDDDEPRLENIGDINGDGTPDILNINFFTDSKIISGVVPQGSLIEPDTVSQYVNRITRGTGVEGIGDINGDGVEDISVEYFNDFTDDTTTYACGIIKGGASLPSEIDATKLQQYELLGLWDVSDSAFSSCTRVSKAGDVNGDGVDDLIFRYVDGITDRLVHGRANGLIDDSVIRSGYSVAKNCYFSETCDFELDIVTTTDFDADGYTDAIIRVSNSSVSPFIRRPSALILYGGPQGLPAFGSNSAPLDNQVSKVYDTDPRLSTNAKIIGDVNGDGSSDIAFGYSPNWVLFATPGKRLPYILLSSLDGVTGLLWSNEESGGDWFGDWSGDAIDDYYSRGQYIPGYAPVRSAQDVESVFVWYGPDTSDISWLLPDDIDTLSSVRIMFDDLELAIVDRSVTRYTIKHDSIAKGGILRVQSLDVNGEVIGESAKWLGSLGDSYAEIELTDKELTAQGKTVTAASYTLRGATYSSTLAELFWNETKRYVLVWRDNEIIARTEGNSYMINSIDHLSGNYFITVDYFGEVPKNTKPLENNGGTLRRSNVVKVDFTQK